MQLRKRLLISVSPTHDAKSGRAWLIAWRTSSLCVSTRCAPPSAPARGTCGTARDGERELALGEPLVCLCESLSRTVASDRLLDLEELADDLVEGQLTLV